MNRRTLTVLLAANLALLVGLAATFTMPVQEADAQAFGARRNFTMISGQAAGRNDSAVVYVIDTNSGDMVGVFYNSANNSFQGIGARPVANDMQQIPAN